MTVDIAEFIAARLDEDEAAAKAAIEYSEPTWAEDEDRSGYVVFYPGESEPYEYLVEWPQRAAHIARHDPARVLREVEAKRRVLARHGACGSGIGYCDDGGHGLDDEDGNPLGCADLHDLATIWSDHPDYRQEWTP